ncbi:hypothetical protein PRIPAC_71168 [Pristionchus pacificus]|nr:hypothetical protein PRIPAC_71168 [Pristionchus pacificus]
MKNQEIDRLNSENYALKEQLEWSMKEIESVAFPLLSLPDELIGHIMSFLPIKDRMRARVCKRLDDIEFKYKYYVPRLLIAETATNDPHRFNNHYITNHMQYFVLLKENVYSIDFFKRLIHNAKFGYLAINAS